MSRKLISGKDRIGNKSGKLEIINYFPSYNTVTGLSDGYFLIKCECENTITRPLTHINRFNKMKHCGCETYLDDPWTRIFNRWASQINIKKKSNTLTFEEFKALSLGNCFYCNAEPQNKTRIKGYVISGIDRIDNTKGYEADNCVSSCAACNYAKHTTPQDEFLAWIDRVAAYQSTRSLKAS